MSIVPGSAAARRHALLVALPLVVLAGLAGRFALPGRLSDLVGGMLYTASIYALYGAARPGLSPRVIAAGAFALSAAIELFQLTSIPTALADAFGPSRLLLGTSFAAADLGAYALGAAAALWIDTRQPR